MRHSKSSLFLMELIIALLFFSISSTVCIRLFVKAHSLSAQTVDQNHAVNYAQNMAEIFTGCEGDLQAMQTILSGSQLSQDGSSLYLDQNGYRTLLICDGAALPGSMISADIYVRKTGAAPASGGAADIGGYETADAAALYTLHVDLHIPYVK